jgi:hypothetical protein
LEIGVLRGENISKINGCIIKDGVDIDKQCNYVNYYMSSNDFFHQNQNKYDVIFVDGLHTEEQSYRDILNSFECLSENGIIFVHDTFPKNRVEERNNQFDLNDLDYQQIKKEFPEIFKEPVLVNCNYQNKYLNPHFPWAGRAWRSICKLGCCDNPDIKDIFYYFTYCLEDVNKDSSIGSDFFTGLTVIMKNIENHYHGIDYYYDKLDYNILKEFDND